jgi:hypothetical protein
MKIERFVASAYPIIYSRAGRNYGTVAQIVGHGAKGTHIGKEGKEVADIPDVDIITDGMRIVEMETIVEMIRISKQQTQHQHKSNNERNELFFFHKRTVNSLGLVINFS